VTDAAGARVLVLGGSGALGGATVRLLLRDGARVAFTWRQGEATAQALRELGAAPVRLDAREPAQVRAAVDEAARALSGLDGLVHAIGVGAPVEDRGRASRHRLEHVAVAEWDELLSVNARSAFLAVQAALPHLRAAGGGNVVFVGSFDARKPMPTPSHYAASKAALQGLTMALGKELGEDRIRVNLVAPGLLEAGLTRTIPAAMRADYEKHCGSKRVGRLDEAAAVIAWLAVENTYVTTQSILVDGGL
jgi:3-oxoacyl-[acyl-carrier protein] reductase